MAFTPEDGTGLEDANSLVSLDYADDYHSDRGNTSWTGTDAVKQAALIKATDYVQQAYADRWVGTIYNEDQALDWPRYIDDVGVVPDRLKQAVSLLALEALTTDLNPSLERGGLVKREKVDVIEVEYMDGASGKTSRPAIDGLLRPFLSSSAYNVKVVRT